MIDNEMHESIHAIASVGVSPIVRIPANEGWMVKRALDAGAHGIIVPLLYSVEDAMRLVQATKFPPDGKRGFGSPFSMGAFDVKGNLSGFDYMKNINDHLLTIVQIETKEALDVVSAKFIIFDYYYVFRSNSKLTRFVLIRSKKLPK